MVFTENRFDVLWNLNTTLIGIDARVCSSKLFRKIIELNTKVLELMYPDLTAERNNMAWME